MTTNIYKLKLSGSTDARPIKVAATSTPGTTIHTVGSAVSGSTAGSGCETIFLTATNAHTVPVTLTIEKGGTTSPDDLPVKAWSIPADGMPYDLPPFLLENSKVLKAFASVTNVLIIDGYVEKLVVS